MKVIDQINGSALFAQSAFSAAIATKDNLGRDITATYLTGVDLGDYATKNEVSSYILKSESGVFQPSGNYLSSNALNGYATQQWVENQGYLTGVDLSNYYQKNETSSKSEIADALSNIPQGDPEVNNVVHTNSSYWNNKLDSSSYHELTAGTNIDIQNYVISSKDWTNTITAASSYAYNQSTAQIPEPFDPTYISGQIDNKLDKSESANYYPMTGNPSGFLTAHQSLTNYYTKTDTSSKQEISAALQYISANAGHTYIGDNPIYVNNTTNHIGITGESLSAGPGIDIFSSGGYVVISGDGAEAIKNISAGEGILVSSVGDKTIITNNISAGEGVSLVYDQDTNKIRIDVDITNDYELSAGNGVTLTDDALNKITRIDCTSNGFPITGTDGTTNFTANANCSAFTLTTGQGAAGCYVNLDAKNVRYEAYPSTDVSASWYNIINKANETSSNCYCVKLNSSTTSVNLATYSAYDRVTVIHSQDYGPDCHLYWDGKTKVFPSGLYCEMAKVKDDRNQDKWTFLNSGWTNDIWWDWD